MAWECRWPGKCANCGDLILVGNLMTRNEAGEIIHADCAGDDIEVRPRVVCGVCFIEKPCGCDDGL